MKKSSILRRCAACPIRIAFCLPLVLPSVHGQSMESINFEFPRSNITKEMLGFGYDLSTGQVKASRCLTNAALVRERPDEKSPGARDAAYRLVSDQVQVERAMQASASASFAYGAASGSVSASLSNSFKFSNDSTWIVARSIIPYQRYYVSAANTSNNPDLLPSVSFDVAPKYLASVKKGDSGKGLLTFRQNCGDGYIRSVVVGGILYGSIEVHNQSQVQKSSFDLQASGSYAGAGGSVNLSSSNMQAFQNKSISLQLLEVGTGIQAQPTDLKAFTAYFEQYGLDSSSFSPRPIFVTISSYSDLPSWPRDPRYNLSALPLAIETAYFFDRRIAALQERYSAIRQRTNATTTTDHNLFFASWDEFDQQNDLMVRTIDALRGLVAQCQANYDGCLTQPLPPDKLGQIVNNTRGYSWNDGLALGYLDKMLSAASATGAQEAKGKHSPPVQQPLATAIISFDFAELSKRYVKWLLSVPLQINQDVTQDEAEAFLSSKQLSNLKAAIAGKSLTDIELKVLDESLKDWILSRKFEPLRTSFCASQAATPMNTNLCNIDRKVAEKMLATFFYDRGIQAPPPIASPAPAPQERNEERQPVLSFCDRYPGASRCQATR